MVAVDEADGLGFGADFEHFGRTFELEILDHRDDVAIGEHIAVGVLDDALACGGIGFFSKGPLVATGLAFVMIRVTKDICHRAKGACYFAHVQAA